MESNSYVKTITIYTLADIYGCFPSLPRLANDSWRFLALSISVMVEAVAVTRENICL